VPVEQAAHLSRPRRLPKKTAPRSSLPTRRVGQGGESRRKSPWHHTSKLTVNLRHCAHTRLIRQAWHGLRTQRAQTSHQACHRRGRQGRAACHTCQARQRRNATAHEAAAATRETTPANAGSKWIATAPSTHPHRGGTFWRHRPHRTKVTRAYLHQAAHASTNARTGPSSTHAHPHRVAHAGVTAHTGPK
jgi:hypothetical protein